MTGHQLSGRKQNSKLVAIARRVVYEEAKALSRLAERIDESFAQACRLILECSGRVIVSGMGKSGHIGQKIAASLTSTGIASHFLHPAEGFHGDLGVVHRKDVLLALSYSGETREILDLLSPVKHLGVPVIAITALAQSTLARNAEVVLLLGKNKEADEHDLIPTTSTTMCLAVGDALTIALMEARAFTPEDFAVFHPRGMLGKRLTLKVCSLLQGEKTNPVIAQNAPFSQALKIITAYTLGGTSIVDNDGRLVGIITDGDIRRIIERLALQDGSVASIMESEVAILMTKNPQYVLSDTLAYDALKQMENHRPRPIFVLPVVDELIRPVGMLHLHALVQAGFKSESLPQ